MNILVVPESRFVLYREVQALLALLPFHVVVSRMPPCPRIAMPAQYLMPKSCDPNALSRSHAMYDIPRVLHLIDVTVSVDLIPGPCKHPQAA